MELTKKGIEKRIEIKNDFVWYHFKNKKLDFSKIISIGGYAYLQGCSKKLKKSLAKTLQKCVGIYVKFQDNSMTLDEFKKYADKL